MSSNISKRQRKEHGLVFLTSYSRVSTCCATLSEVIPAPRPFKNLVETSSSDRNGAQHGSVVERVHLRCTELSTHHHPYALPPTPSPSGPYPNYALHTAAIYFHVAVLVGRCGLQQAYHARLSRVNSVVPRRFTQRTRAAGCSRQGQDRESCGKKNR